MDMQKESGLVKKEKQNARSISIKEGSASSAASGFGDSFIIPFAQFIGSNAVHIGLISAFSGLLSPIAQFFGNKMMEKLPRKKIVTRFVLTQSLLWLPLAIISILYWKNILQGFLPWLLILVYTLIAISGGLVHPAWFTWMGDLVDEKERGKYFSKRNVYTGLVGIIVAILGSLIVQKFEIVGFSFIGFGLMFFLASLFRFVSFYLFKRQYSPSFKLEKKDEFSFLAFIKRYDNFGKFAVYRSVFNFAIMIASPFFGFYLLTELGYDKNLLLFMIISMSSSIFSLIFTPLAGKLSDKYGNLKLLYVEWIFFVLSPLVWLFSKNIIWLILVPGIVAGIANAASAIANTNFIYDSTSREKRGTCSAYTNILVGIGVFIGSLLGGFLLKSLKVNSFGMDVFFIVFILAAIARFLVGLIFLPQLKEVRKVSKAKFHFHPLRTIHHEINGFGTFFHNHRGTLRKV
jgi:MFS family permease